MAPHLDLRHLRMLVALDQHGTVTAAASALGLTQPALSHQIQEAERRAGVPLFRRVKKRLLFTWQGQELLVSARLVVAEMERAEADLARYGETVNALVRLVTRSYCPFGWLPAFLDDLGAAHPDIELEHHGETLTPPFAALESGAADLVLSHGRVRRGALLALPAFEDRLMGLVSADDPLAQRPFLDARDFRARPYVTYSTVLEGGLEHELMFRHGRIVPERYQRTSSVEAMAAIVAAGQGASVVTGWVAKDLIARHPLVALPLTRDGLACTWSVVVRADEKPGQPVLAVAERLAAWLGIHESDHAEI
jgi:LysR family transcriptional regulator for metE and metH